MGSSSGLAGSSVRGVWPAAITSGSLVAQHVAGKATRDALFLTHFGLDLLPAAMIGAAVVSFCAVSIATRALRRWGPARLVPAIFAGSALLFVVEWALSRASERGAAIAVYLHIAIVGSVAVSAFWSLVNERYDPHVAKKIVGRIASGGTIGGVVGGLTVWRASAHLSVPAMLALLAAINVVGAAGSHRVGRELRAEAPLSESATESGWRLVRQTPYLRDLALLVFAGAVVQALLDWLLGAHASIAYGTGASLLGFFALFNMVVGLVSFLLQALVARRLLEWQGLAGSVKSQPFAVIVGAAIGLVVPQLWVYVLLRGGEAVTRNSLYRSAYELFYTPLPPEKKRATKTLIDVSVDRFGMAFGSLALLGIARADTLDATRIVLAAALGVALLSWWVSKRLHQGYVSTLATSLKSGAIALEDDQTFDLTTRQTLAEGAAWLQRESLLAHIEQFRESKSSPEPIAMTPPPPGAEESGGLFSIDEPGGRNASLDPVGDDIIVRVAHLRSGDTSRIRGAILVPLPAELGPFVVPLLANDAVARDVVPALRSLAAKATGQLVDALLDPSTDPRVRRRIPRVLEAEPSQRGIAGLMAALSDPVFEVRVQVALALQQLAARDETTIVFSREAVVAAAVHELSVGRESWSPAEGGAESLFPRAPGPSEGSLRSDLRHRGLSHVVTILGLTLDREPLSIAYRATRSGDSRLEGTAREYFEVVLPPRVRELFVPLLGAAPAKPAPRERRGLKELAEELLRADV